MSHHESTTIRIQFSAAQRCANAVAALGPAESWVSSPELAELSQQVAVATDAETAAALVSSTTGALEMIRASSNPLFDLGTAGQQDLTEALRTSAHMAEGIERNVISDIIGESLPALGWHTRAASATDVAAIEGRRGDEVVLIEVRDGGATEIDFMGTCDDTCIDSMDEIAEAFQAHGLTMQTRRVTQHNSPGGGTLIARAARSCVTDLLEGLVGGKQRPGPRAEARDSESKRRTAIRREPNRGRTNG